MTKSLPEAQAPATPSSTAPSSSAPVTSEAPARRGLRRTFLFGGTAFAVGVLASEVVRRTNVLPALSGSSAPASTAPAAEPNVSSDPNQRALDATLRLRQDRAIANHAVGVPTHPTNGDEERYPNRVGSDHRGLPHDQQGLVDPVAWKALITALESRDPAKFAAIPLGGTRKLINPLGTLATNLTGLAPFQFVVPPAPALISSERAAEAVESYWQSLLRDVPFHELRDDTSHLLVLAAAAELDRLKEYQGPRNAAGKVTPGLLFRGTARYRGTAPATARSVVPPGVLDGPYISQFLLREIPYGAVRIPPHIRAQAPGDDFLTDPAEWLAVQNGVAAKRPQKYAPERRLITTGRDLAEYVHGGSPSTWGAGLLLVGKPSKDPSWPGGFGEPLNPTDPYLKLTTTTTASASFGPGYVQYLLALAPQRAIRSAYWQKWFVHRSIRPEAFGGLVHQRKNGGLGDLALPDDLLNSAALARSKERFGSYLLTSSYPEGAPLHGSYPGGASIAASAAATILKVFYDESAPFPDPVEVDPADPTKTISYKGPALTIGGELNKLATNIGLGRNWAGIHWRSDAAASLPLEEELVISLLRDEKATLVEPFSAFRFTRFDGTVQEVS
jgi:hypothetical protein